MSNIMPFSPTPLFFFPPTFTHFPHQIFEGNTNYDTPELRTVESLLTRFIRIYPERATPAGMGLRLELLGCEIEGTLEAHLDLLAKHKHAHAHIQMQNHLITLLHFHLI